MGKKKVWTWSLLKASHDDFDILEKQRKKGLHSPLKFNFSKKKKKCIFSQTENKVFWKLLLLHFLKKKWHSHAVLLLFSVFVQNFFLFSILITQTLQISHVKDRATFAGKLFILSANHTLRHVEKKELLFLQLKIGVPSQHAKLSMPLRFHHYHQKR